MSNLVPNRTWKTALPVSKKILQWLTARGGVQDKEITSEHELWRVRYAGAVITFYKKGTLYSTGSEQREFLEIHEFIDSLLGPQFIPAGRDFLIGLDETGKGEVFGDVILAGVVFPKGIFSELAGIAGVADSKVTHELNYWENLFTKISGYRSKGLDFVIERIPPREFDQNNVNRLLDSAYQKIVRHLSEKVDVAKTRFVLDDYGAGKELRRQFDALKQQGAEVCVAEKADDHYLESRLASLVAKREQQKALRAIANDPRFQIPGKPIGSGNAGDPKTIEWLKTWRASGREWPFFVKRSFKTIREIEKEEPEK